MGFCPCLVMIRSAPSVDCAHHLLPEAVHGPAAGERDEPHLAGLAWLEANRRAGRDVEPHAAGPCPVEGQLRIGLEEVVVRADLDRAVAGVRNSERDRLAALVERELARLCRDLARLRRARCAADGVVHGDKLRPVREGCLDLHVVDHLGDAVHDLVGGQRDRLRVVELDAALEPPARHHGGHGDQQLVLLPRGEIHGLPQVCQERGIGVPRKSSRKRARSARSACGSGERNRATSMPFQTPTPHSQRASSRAARAASRRASASPARCRTVASARPPAPTAVRASVSRSGPSSLTSSAKTSRPARRIRQRSRKLPLSATSPIATRPNTTLSTSVRAAEAASSTSSRRRRRAPSKRICSWGSQSSRLPGPSAMSTAISVSGPSERYSFSAAWVVRTARAPSARLTPIDMRSPPAMPPPVLISTPSHAPAARGKRTR